MEALQLSLLLAAQFNFASLNNANLEDIFMNKKSARRDSCRLNPLSCPRKSPMVTSLESHHYYREGLY